MRAFVFLPPKGHPVPKLSEILPWLDAHAIVIGAVLAALIAAWKAVPAKTREAIERRFPRLAGLARFVATVGPDLLGAARVVRYQIAGGQPRASVQPPAAPAAPPAPIEPEVPTAKHRTQTMRAVDGRPGYLRLPRWFRRGLRATQHVAVSARAAWSIARALLVAAVLTGCPGWVRPECATPGRYECRANQPHYCGTSKQLTPIGDLPCAVGETCGLDDAGVAHCAPAADGGAE